MTTRWAGAALRLVGATWAGCGDDGPARCDEARGDVCSKGGASGAGGNDGACEEARP
jgi:hypothetical protein